MCKVVFDRPKDWLDIEEMIAWGTAIDDGRRRSAGSRRSSAATPSSTRAWPPCWNAAGAAVTAASPSRQHRERDHRVLQRRRREHERVEDLVVAEHLRPRVRFAARVDHRARDVQHAAGRQARDAEPADRRGQLAEDRGRDQAEQRRRPPRTATSARRSRRA